MYRFSRIFIDLVARILFSIKIQTGFNVPNGPFIAICNHESYLDPPIVGNIFHKYDISFMAKQELFDVPILGAWFRIVKCIPVKRGQNAIGAVKEAIKRSKKGQNIALFPEGTRSEGTGDIQAAKRGTGFLVAKAKVPVIPIFIEGSGDALPKKGKMKFRGKVKAYVGAPIYPQEYLLPGEESNYALIANLLMDKIADLKPKA